MFKIGSVIVATFVPVEPLADSLIGLPAALALADHDVPLAIIAIVEMAVTAARQRNIFLLNVLPLSYGPERATGFVENCLGLHQYGTSSANRPPPTRVNPGQFGTSPISLRHLR